MSDNVALIQKLYQAFDQGDTETIMASLHAEVEWNMAGEGLPWGGMHKGPEAAVTALGTIMQLLEIQKFEIVKMIAQDDNVVVLGFEEGKVKANQKSYLNHWAHTFVVKEGKVIVFRSYEDTAIMIDAIG